MNARLRAVALGALCLVQACDQLGNPTMRSGRTEPTVWRAQNVELVSSSQTFPSENAPDVFRALPPRQLQQVDPIPEAGATVTLVAVEITTPRRALPYNLRFGTRMILRDGSVLQRNWLASGNERTFYSAFVVEQTPVAVSTRLR